MVRGLQKLALRVTAGIGVLAATRAVVRRLNRFDLRGRTVLITGGSRGLGLNLARECARRQARVALCSRSREELDRAVDDLMSYRADVWTYECDVTLRAEVTSMVDRLRSECGPIDVLINNAGIIQSAPFTEMTDEDYRQAMQIHFDAPRYAIEAVLPEMLLRGCGRIVNIASIGGLVSVPHLLPYCASKFALVGYSTGLRQELAKTGVVVTTICPGLMRTGSARNAFFKGRHRDEYAWFKIASSMPGVTIPAPQAARRILDACEHGDALVVLGIPFAVLARLALLFPEETSAVLGMMDRLLPTPGGIGTESRRGFESESSLSESWLTTLTDRAAVWHHEV